MNTLHCLATVLALLCALPSMSFSADADPLNAETQVTGHAIGSMQSIPLIPLTQNRRVFARAYVDCEVGGPPTEDVHEMIAPDFMPFVAMVEATTQDPGGMYCDAHAEASQNSEIQADRLLGSGGSSGIGDNGSSGQYGNAIAQGISEFDVTFEITQDLPYTLSGSISRSGFNSFPSSVALRDGIGGYIHHFVFDMQSPFVIDFNVQGTLVPGQYRLTAIASTSPGPPNRPTDSGSYEFELAFGQPTAVEPTTWGRIKAQLR